MSIVEVIAAALVAGAFMALLTEAGHRAGVIRGNLLRVDGEFALKKSGIKTEPALVHMTGIVVHLVTSAVFGAVLFGIGEIADINVSTIKVIAPYVFILWLAMLFVALPVAGQGILGRRIGPWVWMEQFVAHIVFGAVLWEMIGVLS